MNCWIKLFARHPHLYLTPTIKVKVNKCLPLQYERILIYSPVKKTTLDSNLLILRFFDFRPRDMWLYNNADVAHWLGIFLCACWVGIINSFSFILIPPGFYFIKLIY